MLSGHSLIYFAPEPWDGLWRNRQQLMSIFARHNRVLFVEPRLHLRPTWVRFRRGELARRASLRHIADQLYVFRYPLYAPISGRAPLSQWTRWIRRCALQNALRRLNMEQPIVWFSRPDMVDLIDEISATRLRLYHVVDEYSAYFDHTPESRRWTQQRESEMMTQVDAVIVVSKSLYEAKRPMHSQVHLVPNGVNFEAYTEALRDPVLPARIQSIPAPRLGYIGLIGDKLDFAMLHDVAVDHPQWSIVMLGSVRVAQQAQLWQTLKALPNVYHLDAVPVVEVPNHVKGFAVGLMPYLQSTHANYISPLKLYDYLAGGTPIASMRIPAVEDFAPYIHLADRPAAFGAAIEAALHDTASTRREARRNIAEQHTWLARVEQLSGIIQCLVSLPVTREAIDEYRPEG